MAWLVILWLTSGLVVEFLPVGLLVLAVLSAVVLWWIELAAALDE